MYKAELSLSFLPLWQCETYKRGALPEGREWYENDQGRTLAITRHETERTGSPGDTVRLTLHKTRRYLLHVPADKWDAMIQYVCRQNSCGPDDASSFLMACMEDSFVLRDKNQINVNGHAALLAFSAAGCILLYSCFVFRMNADAVYTGIGLALLYLLFILWKYMPSWKRSRRLSALHKANLPEFEVLLEETIPLLQRKDVFKADKRLLAAIVAGILFFIGFALVPEYMRMSPREQLEYHFEHDIWDNMDGAVSAAMRMSADAAESCLMQKIDDAGWGFDGVYAGALTARLLEKGRFSPEQAARIAEHALTEYLYDQSPATSRTNGKEYLAMTIRACSLEFQRSYMASIIASETPDDDLLKALGNGMANQPLEVLLEDYAMINAAGWNGAYFLSGALGEAGTIQDAKAKLLSYPEEHQALLSGIFGMNFTAPDDVLSYLRLLSASDIPLDGSKALSIPITWDMSAFRIHSEPSNKLPEGTYTILPLIRTEEKEYIETREYIPQFTSDEDVLARFRDNNETIQSRQKISLHAALFASLPEERIPQTIADVDLILLFDQQYVLADFNVMKLDLLDSSRAIPQYNLVQRVSVYDALGNCLLVYDEIIQEPPTLSEYQKFEVYQASLQTKLQPKVQDYCHGHLNTAWHARMVTLVSTALQEHNGDLSCLLPENQAK